MSLWSKTTLEKKHREEIDPERKAAIERTKKLCHDIHVQVPHRPSEGINPKFLEYAVQWINAGVSLETIRDSFGGFVEILRANMVTEFLRNSPRRYLVMIDNDVVPKDPESIIRLCSHDLPVVSGVACAFRPGTGIFACVGVKDKTGIARFPTTMDTKVMPAYGVREVKSCGAGILAIRRDVLEGLTEPAFMLPNELRIEAANLGMLRKTEDIYFCEQVTRLGHKIYVDFSVQCFHDKTLPLHWPSEQLDDELDAAEWDVTERALAVERK